MTLVVFAPSALTLFELVFRTPNPSRCDVGMTTSCTGTDWPPGKHVGMDWLSRRTTEVLLMSEKITPATFLSIVAPTGSVRNVAFNVSGGNLGAKHAGNALIDYSGMSVASILAYADDNRVIALQRPLRLFTDEELKKHLVNPIKIHATACGAKIVTDVERIAALIRAGMPEPLAKLSVTDPTKFAALMDAASGK